MVLSINKRWLTLSNDEIFKRRSFAIAAYEDRYVLVAGGQNRDNRNDGGLRSAAIYDTYRMTSSALPDLPIFGKCKGAILKDYFYIVCRGRLYRLCLSSRFAWEHVNMILPLQTQSVSYVHDVVSNGKYLFIITARRVDVDIILCDPTRRDYTVMPKMAKPLRSYNFSSTIVGNEIYIVGGNDYITSTEYHLSSVQVFNISTQTWSTSPDIPIPLYGSASTNIGRWIVVTGGIHNRLTWSSQSFIFDTIRQKWIRNGVGLSPSRINHSCVAIGSSIVSVGGNQPDWGSYDSTIEVIHKKNLISDWEIIKDVILLRELFNEGRACPVQLKEMIKNDDDVANGNGNGNGYGYYSDKVIASFITDMNMDVFRFILTFLL